MRARMHACAKDCEGVRVFLKKKRTFWKTFPLFGHRRWSEDVALKGRAGPGKRAGLQRDRQITKRTRSPDGLHNEGDGQRRRGGACTYETQSCPISQTLLQPPGQLKTLPTPGTNHYITTHSDGRQTRPP